ncbi:MAG: hypothetical protein KDN18_09005 [Verrucomicrobiae bacterium]|nr:hypothetical protein [Verrucomicrobiae bacterium]
MRIAIRLILTVGSAIILFWISLFDPPTTEEPAPWPFKLDGWSIQLYKDVFFKHRVILGSICTIIATVSAVSFTFLDVSKRKILRSLLEQAINENGAGSVEQHRITIFRVSSGAVAFLSHVWNCIIVNRKAHKARNLTWHYLTTLPKIRRSYMMIYARRGKPHEKGTSTKFLVPEHKNEISGIVPQCYFSEQPIEVTLPSIEEDRIKSYRTFDDVPQVEKATLDSYMRDSKCKCFSVLKSIHRLPNYMLAMALFKGDRIWGVVILDSKCSDSELGQLKRRKNYLISLARSIQNVIAN